MERQQIRPFYGVLTYLCEGNTNPQSQFFSRKLRLSPKETIIIGKGYDITSHSDSEIEEDFAPTGLSIKKIGLLAKGAGLYQNKAHNFIQNHINDIVLTEEQELRLFNREFEKLYDYLLVLVRNSEKRYGIIREDDIQLYQWEVLVDFLFTGDMTTKAQDLLMISLKKALEQHNHSIFDMLLTDVEYWKKAGVNEDRAKMRSIFVREWQHIHSKTLKNLLNLK